jgi:phage portal protein BeeE
LNSWEEKKMKWGDAVITRIREARHQVSEEQGHNPRKLVAYYIQLQKQHKERLLESPQIEDEGRFGLKT